MLETSIVSSIWASTNTFIVLYKTKKGFKIFLPFWHYKPKNSATPFIFSFFICECDVKHLCTLYTTTSFWYESLKHNRIYWFINKEITWQLLNTSVQVFKCNFYLYACGITCTCKLLLTLHTFYNWDCKILFINVTVMVQSLKNLKKLSTEINMFFKYRSA